MNKHIVKGLYDRAISNDGDPLLMDAADEIERLRNECQILTKKIEEQEKEMQKLTIRLIIEQEKCGERDSRIKQLDRMILTACEVLER